MASSPIGEIPVLITGDWSDLQGAIDDAVKSAETGAQDIAAAFSAGGDTGLSDSVEEARTALDHFDATVIAIEPNVAGLADGLTNVGDTAASSTTGLGEASQGLSEVGESGHEAESGLAGTVEKLIELGEALVIADALKEFAQEALEVYGSVQKASISLTALTGSAETADAMIEKLKGVATSDALSFEPLVGAAQKMTALGFSTEQTYKVLQVAADTAAATGASFDRVTQAIERMALSGAAGGRQLAALGVSVNTLGQVMGVAAAQVTVAFKALDQTERLNVLETALAKFGGVAQQVAQGILGQWQNFKTQFEFVMESVGASLAPIAADFLSFITSDILPFIKGLADAFGSLPAPVKDFVVVVGLAAAAIPILNVGLGALLKLLETFEVLNLAEWGTALVASVGNVVYAIENGLLGALTTGEALLLRLGQGALAAAAAFAGWELGSWLYKNIPLMKEFGDAMAGWILQIPGVQSLINQFTGLTAANDSLAKATADLNQKLALTDNELFQGASESMAQFSARVREAAAAMVTAGGEAQKLSVYQQTLNGLIGKAQDVWGQQTMALVAARTNLEAVTSAYKGGTATLGQYMAAQQAVDAAQLAINPNFVSAKVASQELTSATKDLNASQVTLASLLKTDTTVGLESVTTAQQNLKSSQTAYEASLATLQQAQINLNSAVAMGTSGYRLQGPAVEALKVAETNAKIAKDDLTSAQKSLTQAQKDSQTVQKVLDQATKDFATDLTALNIPAVKTYAEAQAGLQAAQNGVSASYNKIRDAAAVVYALQSQGKEGTDEYKDAVQALVDAEGNNVIALANLKSAEKDVTTTKQDSKTATDALTAAEQALESLYKDNLTGTYPALVDELDAVRTAKANVSYAADQERIAQNNLTSAIGAGNITDAQQKALTDTLTLATKNLKAAKTDLSTATGALSANYKIAGVNAAALTDVTDAGTIASQNADVAFQTLGLDTVTALQTTADAATQAYNVITNATTISVARRRAAEIKWLQDEQALFIAQGGNLSLDQQQLLDNLLAQQTVYVQQTKLQMVQWQQAWATAIVAIDNSIQNDLVAGIQGVITGTQSVSAAFIKMGTDILNEVLKVIVGQAIKPLLSGLNDVLSSITGIFGPVGTGGGVLGISISTLNSQLAQTSTALSSTVTTATGDMATAVSSAATDMSSAASSATSSVASATQGALSAVSSSVSGIVSAIGSVVGAIAGIFTAVETAHSNTLLDRIEHETARMAIYLGDNGSGSILGLMWRLVNDLEYGEIERGMNLLASYGLKDLDAISSNTYWSLQKLQEIDNKTGAPASSQSTANVNVAGTDLSTIVEALDFINDTLQYNLGLNKWWQTAIQNVNNGIVACAGWLQGIAGILQSGISVAGSTTSASTTAVAALANYIGQNFTSLETWLFDALGKTMALPALPSPVAIPSALGVANSTRGGLTVQVNTTVQGSVVGQAGMKQFTDLIGNTLINKLRNAGLKY